MTLTSGYLETKDKSFIKFMGVWAYVRCVWAQWGVCEGLFVYIDTDTPLNRTYIGIPSGWNKEK